MKLAGKLFTFLLIGIACLIPICRVFRAALNRALSSSPIVFSSDVKTIIAGDSQTETSLDPDWIDGSINLSMSAENYFLTFYKIRHFLAVNPWVETVILGYTPHNIARFRDEFVFDDRGNQLKKYMPILDRGAFSLIHSWRLSYVISRLQYQYGMPFRWYQNTVVVKELIGRPLKRQDFPFFGDYNQSMKSDLDEAAISAAITRHFLDREGRYAGTSSTMITYLNRIADMCQERRVTLTLISTPLSPGYRSRIPREALREYYSVLDKILLQYPKLTFLNLSDMQLPVDSYLDGNHVNSRGARAVTEALMLSLRGTISTRGKNH
jgi:hypothetical protein